MERNYKLINRAKKLRVCLPLAALIVCSACVMNVDTTGIQRDYVSMRNQCRGYAEEILKYNIGVSGQQIAGDGVNNVLATTFSNCMERSGWSVASTQKPRVVVRPEGAPSPAGVPPQGAQRQYFYPQQQQAPQQYGAQGQQYGTVQQQYAVPQGTQVIIEQQQTVPAIQHSGGPNTLALSRGGLGGARAR